MNTVIKIGLALCLAFFLAGGAAAIDKSKKTEKPKEKTQVTTPKATPESTSRAPEGKKVEPDRPINGYDDFIDRNNNGIDDRAEKRQASKKPAQKESSQARSKKNPKR
jgi:hypothetical protein